MEDYKILIRKNVVLDSGIRLEGDKNTIIPYRNMSIKIKDNQDPEKVILVSFESMIEILNKLKDVAFKVLYTNFFVDDNFPTPADLLAKYNKGFDVRDLNGNTITIGATNGTPLKVGEGILIVHSRTGEFEVAGWTGTEFVVDDNKVSISHIIEGFRKELENIKNGGSKFDPTLINQEITLIKNLIRNNTDTTNDNHSEIAQAKTDISANERKIHIVEQDVKKNEEKIKVLNDYWTEKDHKLVPSKSLNLEGKNIRNVLYLSSKTIKADEFIETSGTKTYDQLKDSNLATKLQLEQRLATISGGTGSGYWSLDADGNLTTGKDIKFNDVIIEGVENIEVGKVNVSNKLTFTNPWKWDWTGLDNDAVPNKKLIDDRIAQQEFWRKAKGIDKIIPTLPIGMAGQNLLNVGAFSAVKAIYDGKKNFDAKLDDEFITKKDLNSTKQWKVTGTGVGGSIIEHEGRADAKFFQASQFTKRKAAREIPWNLLLENELITKKEVEGRISQITTSGESPIWVPTATAIKLKDANQNKRLELNQNPIVITSKTFNTLTNAHVPNKAQTKEAIEEVVKGLNANDKKLKDALQSEKLKIASLEKKVEHLPDDISTVTYTSGKNSVQGKKTRKLLSDDTTQHIEEIVTDRFAISQIGRKHTANDDKESVVFVGIEENQTNNDLTFLSYFNKDMTNSIPIIKRNSNGKIEFNTANKKATLEKIIDKANETSSGSAIQIVKGVAKIDNSIPKKEFVLWSIFPQNIIDAIAKLPTGQIDPNKINLFFNGVLLINGDINGIDIDDMEYTADKQHLYFPKGLETIRGGKGYLQVELVVKGGA